MSYYGGKKKMKTRIQKSPKLRRLNILDRHLKWRSLDPTLAISSTFVKREHFDCYFSFASFFLQKMQFFIKMHLFSCIWLSMLLSTNRLSVGGLSAGRSSAGWSTTTRSSAQLSVWFSNASQSVLIDSSNGTVHYFLLFFPF